MHYRVISVPLTERKKDLVHLSHQALDLKLEHVMNGELEPGVRLLGHYVVNAPNIESSNPKEHVPAIHFMFEIADEEANPQQNS